MTIEAAIRAGEALLEAKDLLNQHGAWLPWLRDNCQISERSAQRYMRLARNKDALTKNDSVADLTLNAASLLLGNAKAKATDSPLDEPFTDEHFEDFELLVIKLLHVSDVPEVVKCLLYPQFMCGVPALALASFDDLKAAGAVLATYIHQPGKGLSVLVERTESARVTLNLAWAAQSLFYQLYKEVEARSGLSEEACRQRAEEVRKQTDAAYEQLNVAFEKAFAEVEALAEATA
jgi:hypothetical protein